MWRNVLWTAVVATSACLIPDRLILEALDRDRDGELNGDYHGEFGDGTDCDDNDPAVGADMPETCGDGTDNDCDGDIDEDSPEAPIWFFDRDGDGHGDADRPRSACTKPSDHEPDATDCDDNQPAAHPGAVERCNGLDDDCDGDIDESGDPITWYADQDGDGHGDPTSAQVVCERPRGHVQTATDCNDHADWIHPGSFEVWYDGVDADCRGDDDFDRDDDGARHPSAWADAPPWDAVVDCDDGNRRIYPSAPEIWYDGVDQDCDPETEWDFDRDGLTHPSAPVGTAEDCDDARADIGAPRWWFPDSDGDSYGATGAGTSSCSSLTGHVTNGLDCDDGEPDINPDGLEACNGVDDDCDGATDEHGGPAWWPDLDGDGQGDESANPNFACATPQDHVQNADDCDDTNPLTGRGFNEICDGEDNNCNNRVDEGVVPNWYPDDDHDDFGDANVQP
jgi:hypothetical protein